MNILASDDAVILKNDYIIMDAALKYELIKNYSNIKNFYDKDIYRYWRRALKNKDKE